MDFYAIVYFLIFTFLSVIFMDHNSLNGRFFYHIAAYLMVISY